MSVKVKIVNRSNNSLPEYATIGSSGLDIRAFIDNDITIGSMERKMIPTGIYLSIPNGYEVQIRARSGLSIKHGITLVNGIGTIDSDYRGEVGVLIINLSSEPYTIKNGDKIAQMVLCKYELVEFEETNCLDETQRDVGGFGHTGY